MRHKEFLKRLRATADVLTLSATPIPRTLYLSMTGARDLSLIRTPPRERVAVETKVVRDLPDVVRSAIEAEIARGGRVSTIGKTEKHLAQICPGARIVVAHGQMDAKTLARKMRDFERGKFDILLSTTIVESGIDIPRANTIIVDHAEMFGLADLYQLRGRVGRSCAAASGARRARGTRTSSCPRKASLTRTHANASPRSSGTARSARGSTSPSETSSSAARAISSARSSRATSRQSASGCTASCCSARSR